MATSAIPIGMPGWPELAACTASIASARMALASSATSGAGLVVGVDARVGTVSGAVMAEGDGGSNARSEAQVSRSGKPSTREALLQSIKIIAQAPILGNNIEFN